MIAVKSFCFIIPLPPEFWNIPVGSYGVQIILLKKEIHCIIAMSS